MTGASPVGQPFNPRFCTFIFAASAKSSITSPTSKMRLDGYPFLAQLLRRDGASSAQHI